MASLIQEVYNMLGMVFDIETTGLREPIDIVEFSYMLFDMESGTPIDTGVDKLFLPSRAEIDPGAFSVTGISEEYLRTYTDITFENYIPELISILSNVDYIVGHNITTYDLRVIRNYDNTDLNSILATKKCIDTMQDYLDVLHKITCLKNSSELSKSYLKLIECYYFLLRNGYTQKEVLTGFRNIFPESKNKFHNASFDVYITYLTYLYVRGVTGDAKTIS